MKDIFTFCLVFYLIIKMYILSGANYCVRKSSIPTHLPICHKMSQFDEINEKDISRIKLLLNSLNLKRVFDKRV